MGSFVDAAGVEILTREWPVPEPRALVQVSHGIGEHSGRYAELAADLNRAGFSVFADDHRGHGRTGLAQWHGDRGRLGRLGPGGLRATIAAIHDYTLHIRAANPGLPLVLFGHSWGSLMAQIDVNAHAEDYDGLALSGTAYRMPGHMDSGDLNRRHRIHGITGAEWLSRDAEVALRWVADPLTFPADTARLLGVRDGLRLFGVPRRALPARLPVLIQAGSDDTLAGERSVRRLAGVYRTRAGLPDVTVHLYPGARHEVINETNRDEVIADLVAWLEGHVVARAAA